MLYCYLKLAILFVLSGWDIIKYAANIITIARIIGAVLLLLTMPLSALFFVIYFLCCISDILDGYIARKSKTASKFGEILDSVADLIFTVVIFYIFIPLLNWEQWIILWLGIIAFIRFLTFGIGYVKYRTFSFLHTYTNKVTGVALICFPILHRSAGLTITAFILCGIASLSALEEIIITVCSKKLDRNIKSIITIKNHRT